MSNAVFSSSDRLESRTFAGIGLFIAVVLVMWLALVCWLGAEGVFVPPLGIPPLALLIAVTAPVIVFLFAFWIYRPFHDFILATDLRLTTATQAWRFGGFTFLALYAYGILPGFFAWPAGLGDMAIGITAPWIVSALIRRPGFAAGKIFVAWNLLGILDLIVAVSSGAVVPLLFTVDLTGLVTTSPMTRLPMVLIPAYLVPAFIILHLTALFQARGLARGLRVPR